jgi:hypothetical protein
MRNIVLVILLSATYLFQDGKRKPTQTKSKISVFTNSDSTPPTFIFKPDSILALNSYRIIARSAGKDVSTSTGFVIYLGGMHFLVSAWHGYANQDFFKENSRLGNPIDTFRIIWYGLDKKLHIRDMNLVLDEKRKRYVNQLKDEKGNPIDVIVFSIPDSGAVDLHKPTISAKSYMIPGVGDSVLTVGFPEYNVTTFPQLLKSKVAAKEVNTVDSSFFLISPGNPRGTSGSPVYIFSNYFHINAADSIKTSKTGYIIGVTTGTDFKKNVSIVWTMKGIIKSIEKIYSDTNFLFHGIESK